MLPGRGGGGEGRSREERGGEGRRGEGRREEENKREEGDVHVLKQEFQVKKRAAALTQNMRLLSSVTVY